MTAVAGALLVALGGCSSTSWNDMMSRTHGNTNTAGSTDQSTRTASSSSGTSASTHGTSSAMSANASNSSYGTPNSGRSNAASEAGSNAAYGASNTGASTASSSGPSSNATSTSNTLAGKTTTAPSSMSMGSTGTYAQNSTSGTYGQNQATSTGAADSNATPSTSSSHMGKASTRDANLVREVQQALNEKGYNPGPIDGKWGPRTQAALTKFQKSEGITGSRQLDDQTLTALGVDTSNIQTSQAGKGSANWNTGSASSDTVAAANSNRKMQKQ